VPAQRSDISPVPAGPGPADLTGFIRAQTRLAATPLIPEVRLWLSQDEPTVLWERLEQASGRGDLPPPFWAFPWTGGIALARYLLDHPGQVAGQTVLDLASGSGLVAIVAARLGADVTASDIDPVAITAIGLNAAANGVTVKITDADLLAAASNPGPASLVLVGDAFYERRMAHRALAFLRRMRAGGARVLIGDPGRAYLPPDLRELARYPVPAWAGLEDTEIKPTTVWELP
jgi:predicted nicotinamide N-methyase